MANGVITWNGVASDTLGIIVRKVPGLNRPQRKYNSYSVPGRNGDLVVMQDAFETYEQSYEIFTLDGAQTDARAIVDWLYQDGWCKLSDDWEPDYYRMAYFVGPIDIEPIMSEAAVCTITFRCKPQRYIVAEPIAVTSGDTVTNNTNHVAKPIITMTGGGEHSMLKLNKTVTATNYGGFMYFKTELLENIGWIDYGKQNQTDVYSFYSADYASGKGASVTVHDDTTGTFQFTSWKNQTPIPSTTDWYWGFGTAVEVNPDTDYTISCNVEAGTNRIKIAFFDGSASKTIINYAEATKTGAGSFVLTFHTPLTCSYALIAFARQDNASAKFSQIMLVAGTEPKEFNGYVGDSQNILTVGNKSLAFSVNGFSEAVIDCERENLSIDGANSNMTVTVTDQYGNISPDYLSLDKGANVVTYNQDITSVTMDLRLWEL